MHQTLKLTLEFIILSASSIAYMAAIVVLFLRKIKAGHVAAYILYILTCLYWSLGEIGVILVYVYNRPYLNLVISVKYIAGFLVGPFWLVFSEYYISGEQSDYRLGVKKTILIFLPAGVLALLTYTSYYHRMFEFGYMVDGLVYYSWPFWLHIAMQFSYYILGIILIARYDIKICGYVKKSSAIIIIGNTLSFLVVIIYYAFQVHHQFSNMDIVPSAYTISLVFFMIAFFKYRFLNILPMAMPQIIQNLREGIFIVDYKGRVASFNKALAQMFQNTCKFKVGMDALEFAGFMTQNCKYDDKGKAVIRAIGRGSYEGLKGEVEMADNTQIQLTYQPLFEGNELIGWVVSFIDIGEHKSLVYELNEKNERLSEAYSRLLEYAQVVEELSAAKERNKLAREIHDSQGHSMALIIALLGVAKLTFSSDLKTTEDKINTAYDVAQNGLFELRNTVSRFISIELKGYSLPNVIQSMIDGFKATGLNVDFMIHGNPSEELSNEMGTVIYNICREALTNALKHAEASCVNIILRFNSDFIDLFIFDNGKGCKQLVKGVGLMGMESRIMSLNGKISLGSGGEKGFSIHVTLPFK